MKEVNKLKHACSSYFIPRRLTTSNNWIITRNTILVKKQLEATIGPNISSRLQIPNFK